MWCHDGTSYGQAARADAPMDSRLRRLSTDEMRRPAPLLQVLKKHWQ